MQGKQITQIVLGGGCVLLGARLLTVDTSEDTKQEAIGYKLLGIGAICIGAGNIFLAIHGHGGGGGEDGDEAILPDPDGGEHVEELPSELHVESSVPDSLDAFLAGVDNA